MSEFENDEEYYDEYDGFGFQNDYDENDEIQDLNQDLGGDRRDFDRVAIDIGDIGRDATPEDKIKGRINIFVNDNTNLINTYGFDTNSEYIVSKIKDEIQIMYLNPECLFLAYNSISDNDINSSKLEEVFEFLDKLKTDKTLYYIEKVDIIRYARFLINQ